LIACRDSHPTIPSIQFEHRFVSDIPGKNDGVEHLSDLSRHGDANTVGGRVGKDGVRGGVDAPVDRAEIAVVEVEWVVGVDCKA